ncbi:MAG TPA: hypothetical protein VN462_00455 [Negativicutes bacterium]|nr:hypothetical protein [Negativicutes bacterium]
MLTLDVIGLIISVFLIGLRYAHYACIAVVIGALGSIMMSLFVNAQVDTVVAAGVFSRMNIQGVNAGLPLFMIYFGGPLVNYFIGMACGGPEKGKLARIVNPFAKVRYPFAVTNIRLAILSMLYNGWQYFFR